MRKLYIWPYYQLYVSVEKNLKIHLTCKTCHCEHAYLRERRFGSKIRFFTNGHFSRQQYNLHSKFQRLCVCSINGQIWSVQNFDNAHSDFTLKLQSQITIVIHNVPLLDITQNKPFHTIQSKKYHFCAILFSTEFHKHN